MKKIIGVTMTALITAGMLSMTAQATQSPTQSLSSEADKISYALGYQTGKAFQMNQLNIDSKVFMEGLNTALNNQKPTMSEKAMQTTLENLQRQYAEKMQQKMAEVAAKNLKISEEYLANNKKQPGVQALSDGVQYKIITEGKGVKPTLSDSVTVDYEGKLTNQQVFDSSYQRGKPATFPISGLIKGWQAALIAMPVGSTWEIVIPPKLAYGASGIPGAIEPNEALVFKVHLISIEKK